MDGFTLDRARPSHKGSSLKMRLRSRDFGKDSKEYSSQESDTETQQNGAKQDMFVKEARKDGGVKGGIMKDKSSVLLLVFLYVLQGIPLGLAGSMPMVLQNTGITYKQQAVFSLVFWPFSLKLLWAPIVDSVYFKSLGRRKTWLIPTQYLIGIFMLVLSMVSFCFGFDYENPHNVDCLLPFSITVCKVCTSLNEVGFMQSKETVNQPICHLIDKSITYI